MSAQANLVDLLRNSNVSPEFFMSPEFFTGILVTGILLEKSSPVTALVLLVPVLA